MSNVWFTSDLHLGHNNICKYRPEFSTAEEHHKTIIENIKGCVKKRDILWVLGDSVFTEEWLEPFSRIACTKFLTIGNHCIAPDTEVLTSYGWRRADKINEFSHIASVDLSSDKLYYGQPLVVSRQKGHNLFSVIGENIMEVVSEGHNCVYDNSLLSVKSLKGVHRGDSFKYFSNLCNSQRGTDYTPEEVALLTWVIMEGCMVQGGTLNKKIVQFKLSKTRKIEALKNLLEAIDIPYTLRECKESGINKLQPYYISIYGQYARDIWGRLGGVKKVPSEWMFLGRDSFNAFLETLAETDGSKEYYTIKWVTVEKHNVDTVQAMCVTNGVMCKYKEYKNETGFDSAKLQYEVIINTNNREGGQACLKSVKVGNLHTTGDTIAIHSEKGTLVCRRDGCAYITGNCSQHFDSKKLYSQFDRVYGITKRYGTWLSHAPIHPDELRGSFSTHGHTHRHIIDDPRYINVCLEHHNYKPIDLMALKGIMEERKSLQRGAFL